MISQLWALAPPVVFSAGGVVKERWSEAVGAAVLALSGLAWVAYGVLRNEVTIWVAGALIASAYCSKLPALARAGRDGKLDGEDSA